MPLARDMYSRAGWTLAFTAIMYINSRAEFPGPSAVLAVVLALIAAGFVGAGYGLTWIAGEGRKRVLAQILDSVNLQGGERVLDVSAGPDLAIAAAQRLKSGKVISLGDPAANEAAREQAKAAGVADRVRFEPGDPEKLAYPDANFDVVVASRGTEGLDPDRALQELARVLKPGGRIAVHEIGRNVEPSFSSATLAGVTFLPSGLPLNLGGRVVTASKA